MFGKFWKAVKVIGVSLQSPFLLLIRLYWGYQFAITGFGKFLNLEVVTAYFQSLEIPLPYLNATLAASTELIGGLFLMLGLFSRIITIPLLGVMSVAYLTAGYDSLVTLVTQLNVEPFFQETPFLFAYASLIVFCFGPGKISVDYWLTGAFKEKKMP